MSPEIMVHQCPLKDLTILMHKADQMGALGTRQETNPILQIIKKLMEDFVAFGGNSKGGKITGKVSQMCDKKNRVLFTDTECVILSLDFKLTDESHDLLKVPRKDNMYNFDLKNVVPQRGLTCLFAKATPDESNL
ncbi:hypothetical protein Tco_1532314 [Tanacetum coccineum]